MQNKEENRSFLWHKQVNHYIAAILQIWVYTAHLETNRSRLPSLSRRWKEPVFLRVLRRKARTSLLYSTRHVVQIHSRMLNNKYLFVDLISSCKHVIEAYSKIVCHTLSRNS